MLTKENVSEKLAWILTPIDRVKFDHYGQFCSIDFCERPGFGSVSISFSETGTYHVNGSACCGNNLPHWASAINRAVAVIAALSLTIRE